MRASLFLLLLALAACLLTAAEAQYRPKSHTKTRTRTRTRTRSKSRTRTPSRTPTPSSNPNPPHKPQPGEIWSAFFAVNTTDSCATDYIGAQFYVARWAPSSTTQFTIAQPFGWPQLQPIHSKTLQSGQGMAVDSVGRRGWALLGTTDWSPHTWIVELAFPINDPTAIVVNGVCELLGMPFYGTKLYYHRKLSANGPWFLNNSNFQQYPVQSVSVPALSGAGDGTNIPACVTHNVSSITDPAFNPNSIPPPFVGTDAGGSPLYVGLSTSLSNTSQTNISAWSPITGARVFGPTTFACGYPSYLYACPPTNGANWPMTGLFGYYFVNGTLLVGGGDWSSQQYFQGILPIKPAADDDNGDAERAEEDGEGSLLLDADAGGIPVLTYVNSSSNQGTWLATNYGSAFIPKAGAWPLSVQFIQASPAACAKPTGYSSVMVNAIDVTGWNVSAVYQTAGPDPGCPLRQQDFPGWIGTAACAGASIGYPDLVSAFH